VRRALSVVPSRRGGLGSAAARSSQSRRQGTRQPAAGVIFRAVILAVLLVLPSPVLPSPVQESTLRQANKTASRGDYNAAIELYEKAAREEPKNAAVYHMWGRTLANIGEFPRAIEQYKKAVELSPHNPELLNDLGVT